MGVRRVGFAGRETASVGNECVSACGVGTIWDGEQCSPACGTGTTLTDGRCVAQERVKERVDGSTFCGERTSWNGSACVALPKKVALKTEEQRKSGKEDEPKWGELKSPFGKSRTKREVKIAELCANKPNSTACVCAKNPAEPVCLLD